MFTIITSSKNAREDLHRTALSIRSQTAKGIQWIIVDGLSTDGTADIIRKNSDIIGEYICESDTGIFNAWNKAIPLVKNEWVIFLGSGDIFAGPEVLEKVSAKLHTKSDIKLAYGDVHLIDADKELRQTSGEVDLYGWTQGRPNLPCHQGVFHHKSIFAMGRPPFDESYKICADAKLILSIENMKEESTYLNLLVSKMLVGGLSQQPASWGIVASENSRLRRDLDLAIPINQRFSLIILYAKAKLFVLMPKLTIHIVNWFRRRRGLKDFYV